MICGPRLSAAAAHHAARGDPPSPADDTLCCGQARLAAAGHHAARGAPPSPADDTLCVSSNAYRRLTCCSSPRAACLPAGGCLCTCPAPTAQARLSPRSLTACVAWALTCGRWSSLRKSAATGISSPARCGPQFASLTSQPQQTAPCSTPAQAVYATIVTCTSDGLAVCAPRPPRCWTCWRSCSSGGARRRPTRRTRSRCSPSPWAAAWPCAWPPRRRRPSSLTGINPCGFHPAGLRRHPVPPRRLAGPCRTRSLLLLPPRPTTAAACCRGPAPPGWSC
jgi:hypothetical protein